MPFDKGLIHNACLGLLKQRSQELAKELISLNESAASDTKSSMGDKYETAREMINLEKEKLAERLEKVNQMTATLQGIDPLMQHKEIEKGAFVQTEVGSYYISVGLGKIDFAEKTIWAISPMAPLAQVMLGKREGDTITLAGRTQQVLSVD